ncbi:MAG: zeta toxin family protein [Defluviitaleaceae bacterium]|nr:zeta toxin family protein [Defluviitaleaceae bacterium]
MTISCPGCQANLLAHHTLDDFEVKPARNKSRIIHPKCTSCGHIIQLSEVSTNITPATKILLITGTCGAGKTSIGQLIESKSDYIFIDGDSIMRRDNHYARKHGKPQHSSDLCTDSVINTVLTIAALGHNVVIGYIINNPKTLAQYETPLKNHGITPTLRVLIPKRDICQERNIQRDCWTADEEWIDKYYEEMQNFQATHQACCIDTSKETLEETFANHFAKIL